MTEEKTQLKQTQEARKLAKLFKVELTISLFGNVIIHWVWPPQNTKGDE